MRHLVEHARIQALHAACTMQSHNHDCGNRYKFSSKQRKYVSGSFPLRRSCLEGGRGEPSGVKARGGLHHRTLAPSTLRVCVAGSNSTRLEMQELFT